MTKEERYQMLATKCLQLAQESVNPTDKALLMEMAAAWRKLAETAAQRGD
jgi:hypothetical protein